MKHDPGQANRQRSLSETLIIEPDLPLVLKTAIPLYFHARETKLWRKGTIVRDQRSCIIHVTTNAFVPRPMFD
jgi:hypothetical protein